MTTDDTGRDIGPDGALDTGPDTGTPLGRRVVLGMLGLGAAGVAVGSGLQRTVTRLLAPVSQLVPAAGGFRFYSVVAEPPARTPAQYMLAVRGLVRAARTFTLADLGRLPQTAMTRDFQCVTGWRVPDVAWQGVALPDLLHRVGVLPGAKAVTFRSFDGEYTESLTMEQAARRDVLVATRMLGGPVSHHHGGPVRLYVAPMYGYKSLKWLGEIEVTDRVAPGFWEVRGYDTDAWIGRSNGRSDAPV